AYLVGWSNIPGEIHVRDHLTGDDVLLASVPYGYGPPLAISADGSTIAYEHLGAIGETARPMLFDRSTGASSFMDGAFDGAPPNAQSGYVSLSGDGRFVCFTSWASNLVPDDRNDAPDVFVRDRQDDSLSRVSVSSNGDEANGAVFAAGISEDGQGIAFVSS